MSPIEEKLAAAWNDFRTYAKAHMGYTNEQNLNECLNGAGAFITWPKTTQGYLLCNQRAWIVANIKSFLGAISGGIS